MIGDYLMIAVHCFQFQNKTLSSFSECRILMDERWARFLSCCVNSKEQFNIIGVYSFLIIFFV